MSHAAHSGDPLEVHALWNRNYVGTLLVSLFINTGSIVLLTLLPLYILSVGGNNLLAGSLTTLLTITSMSFRPLFGRLVDRPLAFPPWKRMPLEMPAHLRNGRTSVLTLGLVLFGVPSVLLLVPIGTPVLMACRFVQGIGLSAFTTAMGTILSDVIPHHRISEGLGYAGIAGTISMAAGPAAGLFLAEQYGFRVAVLFALLLVVGSIGFLFMVRYASPAEHHAAREAETGAAPATGVFSFVEKTALAPSLVLFFSAFAISSVVSFMPLFGKERGIGNIGIFFTVYALSVIVIRLFTGKMADRYGYGLMLVPSAILVLLLFVILAFARSLPAVLLAAVFYGAGFGTLQPVMNTIVIKLAPASRRGAANATFFATMDLGFGIGAFVWGGVSQAMDFQAVFLLCAVCMALFLGTYLFVLHPRIRHLNRPISGSPEGMPE